MRFQLYQKPDFPFAVLQHFLQCRNAPPAAVLLQSKGLQFGGSQLIDISAVSCKAGKTRIVNDHGHAVFGKQDVYLSIIGPCVDGALNGLQRVFPTAGAASVANGDGNMRCCRKGKNGTGKKEEKNSGDGGGKPFMPANERQAAYFPPQGQDTLLHTAPHAASCALCLVYAGRNGGQRFQR